jgi:hypothetical protein
LVEVKPGDITPRATLKGIGFDDARKRAFFEQLRARRRGDPWAITQYRQRYGALPPSDWLESSWS